ncbi:MAG: DsbC family protein [Lysobacteraceae bacterium]|nr:MAG: DsbC family protein [Xanthomonadaceae bacterium]
MMKRIVFALLSSFSLAACAQPANTSGQAEGQKLSVGKASPAATKPIAEPTFAAGSPEERVREILKALNPKIRVDRIGPAPVPGFREVVAGGQVVYVSEDGKYLFQGGLLDIVNRKDMTEAALSKVRGEVLKTLPMTDRIVFSPAGTPKHKVVVLTDIECGYCRKFHSEIAEYTKRGIEVQYLAFPRAGLGSPDYRKMVSVWCADDRKKALTDAKSDRAVASKTCTTPVDMQYNAGLRMGLEGTPMILTTDGQFLGGYLPPDVLRQRLEQVEGENAQAAVGA